MKTYEDGMREIAMIIKEAIAKKRATEETIYCICEDILGIEHDERGYNPYQE